MAEAGDVKPDLAKEPITLRVKDSAGVETVFKVKKSTKFKRILEAYAQKTGANAASLRLSFDGTRLQDDDTPESLEMEDQDVVDVVLQQTGGAW